MCRGPLPSGSTTSLHRPQPDAVGAPEPHEVETHVGRRDEPAGQEHRLVRARRDADPRLAGSARPARVVPASWRRRDRARGARTRRRRLSRSARVGGRRRSMSPAGRRAASRPARRPAPYGSAAAAAMTGAEGRPAASSVIRTTRPSPQQLATSDPPSGATAMWQTASPASTGAPSGANDRVAGAAERLHGCRRPRAPRRRRRACGCAREPRGRARRPPTSPAKRSGPPAEASSAAPASSIADARSRCRPCRRCSRPSRRKRASVDEVVAHDDRVARRRRRRSPRCACRSSPRARARSPAPRRGRSSNVRAPEMSSFQPGKYSRIGFAWWKSDWLTGTSSNRLPSTS